MENTDFLEELIRRHPQLEPIKNEIRKAFNVLIACYEQGKKVLVCGNGGSCSDSDHIVGELMKGFENMRPVGESLKNDLVEIAGERGAYLAGKLQQALPAISLTAHSALITAVANDTDASLVFAQQVMGYGNQGDVMIGISSSGNSQNVIDALITAKAKGMTVIGLTGETGGKMKPFCDILINVPGHRTAFVQELHLPVYHTLCMMVENHFFGNK
ncbi:MAG: SIS domain-containing protein [Prolixibacteraceae bacterium]